MSVVSTIGFSQSDIYGFEPNVPLGSLGLYHRGLTSHDISNHGHSLAVPVQAFKILLAQHAGSFHVKAECPIAVTVHWISDVFRQASQPYDLQQCLPVALLIPADDPGALINDVFAAAIPERYLAGTEMPSDTSNCAVKCCLTNNPHRGLFNGKEKPRIF